MNKFMIEGLDRLGKDTLIQNIQHVRGYHQVLHFSKPLELRCYEPSPTGMTAAEMKSTSLRAYQEASFRTMFSLVRDAKYSNIICNRAHLGECVYAPLYRGYRGDYVFDLERAFKMDQAFNLRLVLLTQDFTLADDIIDDGESFDFSKRQDEQALFISAFERSLIPDKRVVCVTAKTGGFKPREQILQEVIN